MLVLPDGITRSWPGGSTMSHRASSTIEPIRCQVSK